MTANPKKMEDTTMRAFADRSDSRSEEMSSMVNNGYGALVVCSEVRIVKNSREMTIL